MVFRYLQISVKDFPLYKFQYMKTKLHAYVYSKSNLLSFSSSTSKLSDYTDPLIYTDSTLFPFQIAKLVWSMSNHYPSDRCVELVYFWYSYVTSEKSKYRILVESFFGPESTTVKSVYNGSVYTLNLLKTDENKSTFDYYICT